LCISWWKIPW